MTSLVCYMLLYLSCKYEAQLNYTQISCKILLLFSTLHSLFQIHHSKMQLLLFFYLNFLPNIKIWLQLPLLLLNHTQNCELWNLNQEISLSDPWSHRIYIKVSEPKHDESRFRF